MKIVKNILKNKQLWRNILIVAAFVLIVVLGLIMWLTKGSNEITGAGIIKVTNGKEDPTNNMKVTYDLYMDGPTTKELCVSGQTLNAAAQITSAVDQTNSLMENGVEALLGLPSIPDIYGVMAMVSGWLDDNADKCLKEIGKKYCGKEFKGTFTYSVAKGAGSRWYPTWDYFYATETYAASGYSCTQQKGCVFSAEKTTGGYTGNTGSCFG